MKLNVQGMCDTCTAGMRTMLPVAPVMHRTEVGGNPRLPVISRYVYPYNPLPPATVSITLHLQASSTAHFRPGTVAAAKPSPLRLSDSATPE